MSVEVYARLLSGQIEADPNSGLTKPTQPSITQLESTINPSDESESSQSPQILTSDNILNIKKIQVLQLEDGVDSVPQVTLATQAPNLKGAGKYENHSLLIRQRLKRDTNRKYQLFETRAEFRDPHIQQALQIMMKHSGSHNLACLPIIFMKPYNELFHIRDELQVYQSSALRSNEERESLAVLSDFIDEQHEDAIKDYNQLIPNGLITFKRLWTLFPPQCVLISDLDGLERAYRVSKITKREPINKPKFWEISCWGWGYNDGYFGRFETELQVLEFKGAIRILELDAFPLHCLAKKDQQTLQEKLIRGGKKWAGLVNMCHKYYDGEFQQSR